MEQNLYIHQFRSCTVTFLPDITVMYFSISMNPASTQKAPHMTLYGLTSLLLARDPPDNHNAELPDQSRACFSSPQETEPLINELGMTARKHRQLHRGLSPSFSIFVKTLRASRPRPYISRPKIRTE
ncbi:hypothetical protein CRG98_022672 [Punica granatum]|uniref:Uncharacterized protein n=1 Tax=Punica granatum TaxID=22663 RepID=A0A2I0JL35_PUNGR|nr:hypothetical protein CRG98_022672 [Punica granatum]